MKILASTLRAHLSQFAVGDVRVQSEDDSDIMIFARMNPVIFKPSRIAINVSKLKNKYVKIQIDVIAETPINENFQFQIDIKNLKVLTDPKIRNLLEKQPLFNERITDIINSSEVLGEITLYTPPISTEPFIRVVSLIKETKASRLTDPILNMLNASIDVLQTVLAAQEKLSDEEIAKFCWRCGSPQEGTGFYCNVCGVKL